MARQDKKRLDVYVDREEYLKFKELSEEYNLTMSEIVRKFVSRFVTEQEEINK